MSIFAFASLVGIDTKITSSALGIQVRSITAGIKIYESIFKKKEKKHGKIILLTKTNLNST